MNATTLEASTTTGLLRAPRRVPSVPVEAPRRPRRRTGRGTAPEARPARRRSAATSLGPSPRSQSRACTVSAPPLVEVPGTPQWRLTDRGIALVLVTGLLIVTAALAVVSLTAIRVTGDRYAEVGHSVLAQP